MARRFALTTSDNKWNPITHFDEWLAYDQKEKHYNTLGYLARMSFTSSDSSDDDYDESVEAAIDDIVAFNLIGKLTNYQVNYVKVVA